MTPAAAVAAFVQPAAKLATGDAVGGAVGGFEALLAMLTQSLQGGGEPAAQDETVETPVETPAESGDLAALLDQARNLPWLVQTMGQASEAEGAAEPAACGLSPGKGPSLDLTAPPVPAEVAPEPATPGQQAADRALSALLRRQAPETVDPAMLAAAPPAAEPAPEEVADLAASVAQVQAMVQPAGEEPPPAAAETVAAPLVIAPPVEAKAPSPPRKAATAVEGRSARIDKPEAPPVPAAAVVETAEATSEDLAPVEVAAREAEAPEAPARNPEAAVQTLAAKLETVATGAAALAAQVRGAPETVARLAAGILDRLEGQSTKFDLQLDPHGLGKVDVSVEIASDGKLTAQLGFDSQLGMSELRGRAQELRTALEQAGFTLADNALSFDFNGERRGQTADGQADRTDRAGKAFARALGALDEDLAAVPTRYQARRGLDLLI